MNIFWHPVLLEPIVKVEVTVPEEYMGDVMGDLNSRRGRIEGMESRFGAQIIKAQVPMSLMPLSTAGMYSFGITPPTIAFSNS